MPAGGCGPFWRVRRTDPSGPGLGVARRFFHNNIRRVRSRHRSQPRHRRRFRACDPGRPRRTVGGVLRWCNIYAGVYFLGLRDAHSRRSVTKTSAAARSSTFSLFYVYIYIYFLVFINFQGPDRFYLLPLFSFSFFARRDVIVHGG